MTIPEALGIAVQHHQSGRLAEAEAIYRQILAVQPQHVDALHFLGVLAHQVGRHDVAVDLIRNAIALAPGAAPFHSNLGLALAALGRADEAIAAFRRALQIAPNDALAHNNLGISLNARGDLDGAIAAFRRALELRSGYAEAQCNLGNALKDLNRSDEAIAAYRRALALTPDYADAWCNLGGVLRDHGRFDEAVAACRRAIQLQPDFVLAHVNLGAALKDLGHFDEAVAAYRHAIQLQPDFAAAHYNLGNALTETRRLDEGIAAYRRALELQPDSADAHNNLGVALRDQGRLGEAIAAFRRALQLRPDFADAHSSLLLNLHYMADADPEELLREHRRFDELHARPLAGCIAPHCNDPNPGRRLRIGYVSPDFREHAVAYFLESLLAAHDREEVEIFCYADCGREDEVTNRLRQHAAHWHRIAGLSDEQVAALIREDAIDILVDLAGHTAHNRLLVFARKPAPVQVTWLGYCDTTGMKGMDYRLTDAHADPPGATEHLHTEELVRLPETAWCFRPLAHSPPVAAPPVARAGCVTFGCFNARPKITEEILALWAALLRAVSGSRLLLKNPGFDAPSVRLWATEWLTSAGLARERVDLIGHQRTAAEHLAAYGRVDIALDTFPYHGTTTTCEALWMGVPVVTLAGRTHAARVGVSLLHSVGLPDLIAASAEEYVATAAKLAADLPRVEALRTTLRQRMAASPLMDGPRFALQVESAYRQMWRAWCASQCSNEPS